MAAERTPSRRKQCLFRKTFQRFPFGKCERKSRANSSYDVLSNDSAQQAVEKWSPADPGVSSFAGSQGADPNVYSRSPHADPLNSSVAMCEDAEAAQGCSIPLVGHRPMGYHSDSIRLHHDTAGVEDQASQYSAESPPEGEGPVHVALPPSPSISSMETDVEVDPETGERALE